MGMGLKKSLNLLIAFSVVLGQCEIVLAYESEKNNKVNLIEETKEIDNENNKALVTDVYIKGIYENSVLYTGAEIKIEGSTDKDASNQNISWNVTGNNGNVEFKSSGNKASIIAKKPGSVWVMARATDGSYKSREYTVKTENYPKDQFNQSLISKGIRPVLRRKYSNSKNILMVEIEKNSTGTKGRVDNLKSYLNKLTKLGDVRNFKSYMDNHYEYFIINAGNEKIEFRLDRKDESYYKLKTILVDVRKYSLENNVDEDSEEIKDKDSEDIKEDIKEEIETDKENNKEPNIPSNEEIKIPSKDNGKDEIISDDNDKVIEEIDGDKIVNLGGEGSSEENPIIITVNESLQTEDKIEAIDKYIEKIKITNNIYFIRKYDTSLYTSYIFKISKRREMLARGEDIKNDFFIEIRVKKDDKESYKSIIEMLDKIDNKEDEESKAGKNIESEKENSKEIEDSKSNIKDENSNYKMDKKDINNSKSEKNKENKINEVDLSSNRKKVSIFIISTGGLFLLRKKFRNKG